MDAKQAQRPQTASPDSSAEPIDLAHLSRQTFGEPHLERDVLVLFTSQSDVYLARLAGATSGKAWQDAAHSLKGSAKAIGAWRLAEAAEHAETLTGDAPPATRDDHLRQVECALDEAKSFIEARLTRGRPEASR